MSDKYKIEADGVSIVWALGHVDGPVVSYHVDGYFLVNDEREDNAEVVLQGLRDAGDKIHAGWPPSNG